MCPSAGTSSLIHYLKSKDLSRTVHLGGHFKNKINLFLKSERPDRLDAYRTDQTQLLFGNLSKRDKLTINERHFWIRGNDFSKPKAMTTIPTKVLITGDYWHSDFRALIPKMDCVTTLIPADKLSDEHLVHGSFDLIVLAASRRDQFSHAWVESTRGKALPTPLVALLGSWCEGEKRSGEPWPGVQRIYWHQWQNRFDHFIGQLASDQVCDWQLPATSNHADSAMNFTSNRRAEVADGQLMIGVSAVSDHHYQMIDDASQTIRAETCWIEREHLDESTVTKLSLIVVDADSWNNDVKARIEGLRSDLKADTPIVLLLNFPRESDLPAVHAMGILEVVSKPFQLSDFAMAIERAVETGDHSFAM